VATHVRMARFHKQNMGHLNNLNALVFRLMNHKISDFPSTVSKFALQKEMGQTELDIPPLKTGTHMHNLRMEDAQPQSKAQGKDVGSFLQSC